MAVRKRNGDNIKCEIEATKKDLWKESANLLFFYRERDTRLELATSSLGS